MYDASECCWFINGAAQTFLHPTKPGRMAHSPLSREVRPGSNGVTRYSKQCTFCKFYGHSTYYCAEKYAKYPQMKPYKERFEGEESVYEAIEAVQNNVSDLLVIIGRQGEQIKRLTQVLHLHTQRLDALEQKASALIYKRHG